VLALIASGRFDPARVTTLVADWEDAPAAYLERTTKVVVQRPVLNPAASA
jgi:alcohol dehydrogenase